MAKIKKMITNNSIVLIINDTKKIINRFVDVVGGVPVEDPIATKVLAILKEAKDKPELLDADTSPILALIDINVSLKDSPFYIDKVQCKVYVEGEEVNSYLSKKIIQASEAGKYYDHIVNFWKRLKLNPLESARNELFLFLEHNGLPLTKEGYFIAYKTVRNDYYSSHGYTPGGTDNVLNLPGTWVTKKRSDCDTRRDVTCSNGLHAANYHYATKTYGSPKCITLIIDPCDVVAVPSDYNNQKMRTAAYYVLEDCKGEFKENFLDTDFNLPEKPKVYGVPQVAPVEPKKAEVPVMEVKPLTDSTPVIVIDPMADSDKIEYFETYTNAIDAEWKFVRSEAGNLIYSNDVITDKVETKIKVGDKVFATWKPKNNKVIHTYIKPTTNKTNFVKKAVSSIGDAISGFIGDNKPVRGPDGRFVSNKPKTAFGAAVSKFIGGKGNQPLRGPDGKFIKKSP